MTALASTCPCCGQPVPNGVGLVVSLDYNAASRGGKMFRMQPQEAEVLREINKAYPRAVTFERLERAMYGWTNPPADSYKVLCVRICHLRKSLRQMGLTIRNEYGVGYRLAKLAAS